MAFIHNRRSIHFDKAGGGLERFCEVRALFAVLMWFDDFFCALMWAPSSSWGCVTYPAFCRCCLRGVECVRGGEDTMRDKG